MGLNFVVIFHTQWQKFSRNWCYNCDPTSGGWLGNPKGNQGKSFMCCFNFQWLYGWWGHEQKIFRQKSSSKTAASGSFKSFVNTFFIHQVSSCFSFLRNWSVQASRRRAKNLRLLASSDTDFSWATHTSIAPNMIDPLCFGVLSLEPAMSASLGICTCCIRLTFWKTQLGSLLDMTYHYLSFHGILWWWHSPTLLWNESNLQLFASTALIWLVGKPRVANANDNKTSWFLREVHWERNSGGSECLWSELFNANTLHPWSERNHKLP